MKQAALEVNEETLKQLSVCLEATLSPDKQQRKEAEKYLESVETRGNYGLLLLTLLDNGSCNMTLRTTAAVNFKNFVKRNWRIVEEGISKISDTDRDSIKKHIVDLMLRSPETLLRQLSDAISIIGREDFPEKWQDLLPKMVEYMKSGNLHNVNGILQTAHSLFKRFRYEFKSQELWTELKFVLDNFAAPLTDLFEGLMAKGKLYLQQPKELKELKEIFDLLTLTCKLFYSLNYQDLPEYFEDNMKRWMGHFHTLLVEEYKVLQTQDSEEIGPLEKIRSQVCDNVALYAQKYDEEFEPFLPDFVKAIWNLLVSTENKVKYDLLVSNAIQFLASVCERPHYKALFEDHNTLQSICEKVIVPNMEFREADEELFEDNPEEYIRRDIEGSDIDTRRRAACDLVRGLCKFFEGTVISIFSQYVGAMLQMYAKDPANHWKAKDAAIYLVTSLAAKKQTAKHGTTESSQLVNLADFFNNNIAQDLQSANVNEQPVLKADAIKYVITFRSILPRNILLACLPCLVNLLQSKSNVVHSYAASCLERIFTLRTPGGGPPIASAELRTVKEAMLKNLFAALELPGSQENEYVMKGIMRSICVLQEGCLPYAQFIITQLTTKLCAVSKNPSKPQFNHYLFEAICALTRSLSKGSKEDVSKFEIALFPVIQELLQNDVTEFLPYVFQVLSLLLELREGGLEGPYIAFFPLLLQPVLWERTGNIPAITRLLQAYVKRGSKQIVADNKVLSLLGVFQKLIASKANDHEGFYLLGSLIEHMEWSGLENHFKQIMIILFQRLQSSKTTKYVKGFLVFICLFAGRKSADMLISLIDSVQPKLLGMVLEKLFVPDLQKVCGTTERKICAVGITKILTEAPVMLGKDYVQYWVPLLNALIGLFELPEDDSVPDDEHFIEIEDTPGYQTAFTQLMFAGKKEVDPFQEIVDPKEFLAKQLYKLSIAHPGKLAPLISQGLEQKAAEFLQTYLHKAQVSLA